MPYCPEERLLALAYSVAASSLARSVVTVSCNLVSKQACLVQLFRRHELRVERMAKTHECETDDVTQFFSLQTNY